MPPANTGDLDNSARLAPAAKTAQTDRPPGSPPPRRTIDLNCDLAEGAPHDAELLTIVTSANIACGVHAGSPALMLSTAAEAARCGVQIGAHPGASDRVTQGRSPVVLSVSDAFDIVQEQLHSLSAVLPAPNRLRHVKPHGALYNQAAREESLAQAIAAAIYAFNPTLILYGLAGSELLKAAASIGLSTAAEGFADRGLQPDGHLIPRGEPGALITDPAAAAAQALRLATDGAHGIRIDTLCVHGDTPGAVAIARAVRAALEAAGFVLQAPGGGTP